MVAGGAVAWQSCLQGVVATSTAHAEYIAAYEAVRQATYMRDLLTEMGMLPEGAPPTPILCDNAAAESVAQLEGVTNRNKHWEVKLHYVRQQQKEGEIELYHVATSDQLADALTKALAGPQLSSLLQRMGMAVRKGSKSA